MNFLKNKVIARFVIFFVIFTMVLWLIPGNLIFGAGEEGSGTPPGSEQPVTTETTAPPETTLLTDTISPVITLNGDDPVIIVVGTTYTDAGATALDDVDGDITDSITVINTVDTTIPGSYTITYNVSDAGKVKLAYTMAGESKTGGATNTGSGATQMSLGYDHALTKNTTVFASYTSIGNDTAATYGLTSTGSTGDTGAVGADSDPTALAIGIRHSF